MKYRTVQRDRKGNPILLVKISYPQQKSAWIQSDQTLDILLREIGEIEPFNNGVIKPFESFAHRFEYLSHRS